MAIFGGKKRKDAGAEGPAPDENGAVTPADTKQKKRKPDEMLVSVVQESVPGAAVDLLRQNEAFTLPGEKTWVALALPVDRIGGLSKKQSKVEAKGSIIELIKGDFIQVLATRRLLDEEVLGIIPTKQSLDRMSEYELFTNPDLGYYWVVVEEDEHGDLRVDPVADASYKDAVAVEKGALQLSSLIPEVWAWAESDRTSAELPDSTDTGAIETLPESTDETVEIAAVADIEDENVPEKPAEAPDEGDWRQETTEVPDEAPAAAQGSDPLSETVDPDEGVDYAALAEEEENESPESFDEGFVDEGESGPDDEDPNVDEGDEDLLDEVDEDGDDDGSAGYFQYVEENRDREVPEDEVRGIIARRFLSDDLDLTVPLDEFDATFDTQAPAIRLDIADDPSDWMGSQVSQLARQANAELELLHRQNVGHLRELFVQTMGKHADSIIVEVSPTREGSIYTKLNTAAKTEHNERQKKAPEEASTQRRELRQRFDQEADERARVAADQARTVYKDRHGPDLNRRELEVAQEIERRNEESFNYQRQQVQEARRRDAQTRMELGTTRALQLLSDHEADHREAETALLQKWNGELTRFIDENRKNDVARAEALAEQLSRENQIDVLRSEHTRHVEALQQENTDRIRRLEAELARQQEQAQIELRERESEWSHETAIAKEKMESANGLVRGLNESMRDMDSTYRQRYEAQIEDLERDRESSSKEMERVNQIQTRSNKILAILVGVLTVAAIAVGIIVGWTIGHNGAAGAMVTPLWTDVVTGFVPGLGSVTEGS